MTHNPESWEGEFDKKFTYGSFGGVLPQHRDGGVTLKRDLKSFISSLLSKKEHESYALGQKEARAHYYDLVRKETREEVLRESEELPWEIGGRVLTTGKGKDGWWVVYYEDNSLGFPIDKKLHILDQTADNLPGALKKMKEYLIENKLLSLKEQGNQ